MNLNKIINKKDAKLYINWGSMSVYTDFESYFKYTYRFVFIDESKNRFDCRNSPSPSLNYQISPTPILNTHFWKEAS